MNTRLIGLMAAAVLGAAAGAAAQPNLVHNGSFEVPDPLDPSLPEGWGVFNSGLYRTIGDGLGDILVRTGQSSIELASGPETFVGFTTNVLNPDTLLFYDPPYKWRRGPCRVSGWYAIPADQPLDGANAGLKLEFRRENWSIYFPVEDLFIDGHTNGEWQYASIIVRCSDIPDDWPPYPVSVSVLPIRWGPDVSTGTIFWDDIEFIQCTADYTCDDQVNSQDFIAFLNLFTAGDPAADFNEDGSVNSQDFIAFLNAFVEGCSI